MTTIVQAVTDEEISDARRLMRDFATWRREQREMDMSPDGRNFEGSETQDGIVEGGELPGTFIPPRGRLLVAYEADQTAGCAALCDLGDGVCGVTQLFVAARFRGQRMGRALVERLLLEARAAGYQRVRLDTCPREKEAMHLCERAGFHRIDADSGDPDALPQEHVLFERDLTPAI